MSTGDMLVSTIGWFGTVCALMAYLQMANGRWSSVSVRYTAVNAAGGLAGTIATICYGAWSSAASNLAWTAIAVVSLLRLLEERRAALAEVTPPVVEPAPEPVAA